MVIPITAASAATFKEDSPGAVSWGIVNHSIDTDAVWHHNDGTTDFYQFSNGRGGTDPQIYMYGEGCGLVPFDGII